MSRHHGVLSLLVVGLTLSSAAQQEQPLQPQPRPPVFRAGAHYVRVDAYPTGKDGKIIEGLTKDDFEIYEDGKPQAIENSEFITFDTWTPDAERKDPRTQQDAYDLLADPTWRVFVIVIDRPAYGMTGQHYMRGPLHQFIDRNLGPRDLFGLLTTENSAADLVLGQQTTVANAVLDRPEWRVPRNPQLEDRFSVYHECGLTSLIGRRMLDDTYLLLEGLVKILGLIREEKKSIVFVADGLATPGPSRGGGPMGLGLPDMPKIGITNGRLGEIPRPGDRIGGPNRSSMCAAERMKLVNMDFQQRFRDLLRDARQANVSFYPISPSGLQGIPFLERGGFDMGAYRAQTNRTDSLLTLASETDGLAIVNTNDLAGGMRRIANDVAAYYVLGYYTTNTTWDGKPRSIKVRLKPKRNTVRARRQYLAPSLTEIAALSAAASPKPPSPPSAEEIALAGLARAKPSAAFVPYAARAGTELSVVLEVPAGASAWSAGTVIDVLAESSDGEVLGSGRQELKSGGRFAIVRLPLSTPAPLRSGMVKVRTEGMVLTDRFAVPPATSLVGDPIVFRNGTPAAVLTCARTDVLRLEWPVLDAIETRQARLLDRKGQPLPIPVNLEDDASRPRRLVTELTLAPLARGDYLVELTVAAGTVTERKLLAVRVK
jgi:VWFA-related protein